MQVMPYMTSDITHVLKITSFISGIHHPKAVNLELVPDKGGMHTFVQRVLVQNQTNGVPPPGLAHRPGGMDDIIDELCPLHDVQDGMAV